MRIEFQPLPTDQVQTARRTRRDAHDQPVEVQMSQGAGTPCRHCLRQVPQGQEFLVLAWRPFEGLNPYTETGPIFLCAADCAAARPSADLPAILGAPSYLVRGYSGDERIRYGTGQVTPTPQIADYASALLSDPQTAFVDIRSAANNCFQCRVRRAG